MLAMAVHRILVMQRTLHEHVKALGSEDMEQVLTYVHTYYHNLRKSVRATI